MTFSATLSPKRVGLSIETTLNKDGFTIYVSNQSSAHFQPIIMTVEEEKDELAALDALEKEATEFNKVS